MGIKVKERMNPNVLRYTKKNKPRNSKRKLNREDISSIKEGRLKVIAQQYIRRIERKEYKTGNRDYKIRTRGYEDDFLIEE